MLTGFWWGNLKERIISKTCVDGRMRVKCGLPKQVKWENMNRIFLAQNRRRWRAVVIAAISIQFQTNSKTNTPLQLRVKI
jgi:hypothetical protein